MTANVETMFSVKLTPWHGIGKILDKAPTIEDAIKAAGLDWTIKLQDVYLADGTPVATDIVRAVVRMDTGMPIGKAGPRTVPLQNAEAFDWFNPCLEAGEASLETGGSLDGGRKVWILARIGHNGDSHADVVPGDEVTNHWLLSNAHDGTSSIRVGRVRTRVVCSNTLAAAHAEGTTLRVRHTKGAKDTLAEIRDVMRTEADEFAKDVESFRALAKRPVTSKSLREYVQAVFPKSFKPAKGNPVNAPIVTPVYVPDSGSLIDDLLGAPAPARVAMPAEYAEQADNLMSEIYDRVVELVETGRGSDLPGVRGTMWGAYNAVNEYLQYESGRGPKGATEKRLASLAWGQNATTNQLALNQALAMSGYMRSER